MHISVLLNTSMKMVRPNPMKLTSNSTIEKLRNHVPEASYGYVIQLIESYGILFRISKPRVTKLGDYRFDPRSGKHMISVNTDLNKYLFLITFIHEVAHFRQQVNNRRRTSPHGREWKQEFQTLMSPLLEESVFPSEIADQLSHHMENPKASCTDISLMRLLKFYDQNKQLTLEDLKDGDLFKLSNRQLYRRKRKLRTRYECIEVSTERKWFVHALTKVEIVN